MKFGQSMFTRAQGSPRADDNLHTTYIWLAFSFPPFSSFHKTQKTCCFVPGPCRSFRPPYLTQFYVLTLIYLRKYETPMSTLWRVSSPDFPPIVYTARKYERKLFLPLSKFAPPGSGEMGEILNDNHLWFDQLTGAQHGAGTGTEVGVD